LLPKNQIKKKNFFFPGFLGGLSKERGAINTQDGKHGVDRTEAGGWRDLAGLKFM
jgi:hypothetical protein